jgi:hypothetical protein
MLSFMEDFLRSRPHRTIEGVKKPVMKRGLAIALVGVDCLMAAGRLHAQAAPAQNPPTQSPSAQSPTGGNGQNPPTAPHKPAAANPFPEDTTNVPVMPSKGTPALPEGTYTDDDNHAGRVPLPKEDLDPVRSPDDAAQSNDAPMELTSSDSRAGLDKLLPATDDDDQPRGKHRKMVAPEHKETSKEDIQVGGYYLETKNWKAALSRFESALVLAPDEPEVYWGLAESERHLGNLAAARAYYQKVAEYDPDSKHGKEAMKALREPEIANAKAAEPAK